MFSSKYYIWLILLLLLVNSVFALNENCQRLSFIDENSEKLVNFVVYVENTNQSYMDSNGEITFCNYNEERYDFSIKGLIDGKLYFSRSFVENNINVMPIAHINGIVMDSYDNLLPNAELEFQCPNSLTDSKPETTNKFGVFNIENIPLGECVIIAKYGENTGFVKMDLIENSEYHINITVTSEDKKGFSFYWILYLLFVVLLLVIFRIYYTKQKVLKKEQELEKPIKITTKMSNIMKTLKDNELKILTYLIEMKGCASQTQIRKNTLIPKTSLHRIIKSLEQKNLVASFSVGKIKKIELTDFFLEK